MPAECVLSDVAARSFPLPATVSRGALWAIAALSFAVTWAALVYLGRKLNFANATAQIALVVLGVILTVSHGNLSSDRAHRIADSLELLALFGLLSASGALASYVVAITSTGYVDDLLAKVGPMLGFSWPKLYAFTATHPAAIVIGQAAYLGIFWMPFVLMSACGLNGRMPWGRSILLAYAIALAFTMLLFFCFPAKGALGHFGARPDYMPISRFDEITIIAALRDGSMSVIEVAKLKGIINFPSFHASAAIIFIWGAWPIRRIRWLFLVSNVLMLAATPVEGTHYIADLIGGIIVALAAISVVYTPALVMRTQGRMQRTLPLGVVAG